VALLSPIFCLELDMAVVRFLAPEEDKYKVRRAVGSMLMTIIAVSIITFAIVNLLAPQLSTLLFGDPGYTIFVRLTFLWVICSALFVFFSSYLRAKNKIKLLSIRSVILNVIIMALVIALASQGVGLEWIFVSVIAAYGAMAVIFFFMIVREIGWPTPNVTRLKSFLAFSLPQIPSFVLLWLIASSDRYFITHFLGLSQAGVYQSSYQLASMTRLFYSPVVYVLYPTLSKMWDETRFGEVRSYLQHSIRLLLTLGIPAAMGIALLSQPLLDLLTTEDYLAGSELVLLISIGTVLLGINQINQQIILLEKRTKILPLIMAVASIVSVSMNLILIPRIGILGAGISNICSYFVLAVIVTIWAGKSVGYSFDYFYLAKVVGATIPMAVGIYFLKSSSGWDILLAIILGSTLFILGLYLLKAFSEKDKVLVKRTLTSLVPSSLKKRG
jgi:O-antigen/teichoic acid export membrane protein